MNKNSNLVVGIFFFLIAACSSGKVKNLRTDDGNISIVFLQMNDVYEISPLPGNSKGGLARVASLRNKLLEENPRVFTILAGDFLNPSLINTLKIDGESVNGRHMIESLNSTGVDLVTFGNHEFDLNLEDLQSRINESDFLWLSSNVKIEGEDSLSSFTQDVFGKKEKVPEYMIIHAIDEDGTMIRIGLISVTLTQLPNDYAKANDIFLSTQKAYDEIEPLVDFVIGITHLDYKDDILLAKAFPKIKLIMGGHDHQNMAQKIGNCLITKADANAQTVYIHRLEYNKTKKNLIIDSELIDVGPSIAKEGKTDSVVQFWQSKTEKAYRELGFDLYEVVSSSSSPYDGRESSIQFRQTNLGELVTRSMHAAVPNSECVILNSGSIRLDDVIKGDISQYDILRMMPYGGVILEVELDGALLYKILSTGIKNSGTGGYLQYWNINTEIGINTFHAGKRKIAAGETFIVAMPAYLLSGKEKNMGFLTADNPGIINVKYPDEETGSELKNDIRKAVIEYLKQQ